MFLLTSWSIKTLYDYLISVAVVGHKNQDFRRFEVCSYYSLTSFNGWPGGILRLLFSVFNLLHTSTGHEVINGATKYIIKKFLLIDWESKQTMKYGNFGLW